MSSPLLDFRTLLRILAEIYGTGEFDTRTVSEDLALYFFRKVEDPGMLLRYLQRVQPKLVSNDLRRLYTMGFLRRRKVPRECSGRGRKFNCGFKYMYQINKQGWRYLEYLKESKVDCSLPFFTLDDFREALEEVYYGVYKLTVLSAFEKGNLAEARTLWSLYKRDLEKRFSSRGFMRFTKKRELFERDTNCWMKIVYSEMRISSLENEIRTKDMIIEILKSELEACINSKHLFGTRMRFGELLEEFKDNQSPATEDKIVNHFSSS